MQRLFVAAYGIIFCYRYEDVGTPCKNTVTGVFGPEEPTSMYAISESKTRTLFLFSEMLPEAVDDRSGITKRDIISSWPKL